MLPEWDAGMDCRDNLEPSQLMERSALDLMALGPLPVQVFAREELSLSGSEFISWQGRQTGLVPRGSFPWALS